MKKFFCNFNIVLFIFCMFFIQISVRANDSSNIVYNTDNVSASNSARIMQIIKGINTENTNYQSQNCRVLSKPNEGDCHAFNMTPNSKNNWVCNNKAHPYVYITFQEITDNNHYNSNKAKIITMKVKTFCYFDNSSSSQGGSEVDRVATATSSVWCDIAYKDIDSDSLKCSYYNYMNVCPIRLIISCPAKS